MAPLPGPSCHEASHVGKGLIILSLSVVAGTVEKVTALAEAKTGLQRGDRVMALVGGGGYASEGVGLCWWGVGLYCWGPLWWGWGHSDECWRGVGLCWGGHDCSIEGWDCLGTPMHALLGVT